MSSPIYSISKTPQWDGKVAVNPCANAPWDRGYGVSAPMQKYRDKNRDARNDLYHLANGQLNNGSFQWPLFITGVSIDFSVQGNIAQSRLTRDFYPHNFTQPAFQVTGQALDEADYGMMCEFVHMCQRSMVDDFSDTNLLQLQIARRGIPGGRSSGLAVIVNGEHHWNQSIHGPHQEIIAKGVVTSVPRQHQAGVPSQTWTIGFQVYDMIMGPYTEGPPILPSSSATWVDLLKQGSNITTNASLLKQNQKTLQYAQNNSVNVIK